ncbi:MAG: endonuclease MutS2 [Bacillota bacterium]|nr:endonuclease MutS2 [Bacillota bacterium]
MDPKTLRILEFDRILAALADRAASPLGREAALELQPSTDRVAVADALQETAEAHALLTTVQLPSLGGIHDVREEVRRASLGGVLDPLELRAVADTARAARSLRDFVVQQAALCPGLAALAAPVTYPSALVQAIAVAISDQGEIADRASDRLYRLRSQQRILGERVRERMQSYLRSPEYARSLQESIVTMREGRWVLPVRQESRGSLPGVVHDVSSSGATVFVEPASCVPLNNELRRLAIEERDEVRRILAELSQNVGAHADELQVALAVLRQLDFALAKGRLAEDYRACRPQLAEAARFEFPAARHPLLPSDTVVPVDIRLGSDFQIMVITGPNTGGKTVTLKTAGLLSVMAQAGLFVPTAPGPVATVFEHVLADIGDEQSIEQSLSTFSSHMGNIVRILGQAGERSLVLLDEVGAGTDPVEGAALAVALLETLHARGCRTMATTHYGQLKSFAYTRGGIANASVSFDPETLAPTFRLSIGVPGSSNALAIARRLGLAGQITERARQLIGDDRIKVEDMIRDLVEERNQAQLEREETARARREAMALKFEYEARLRELEEQWREARDRLRSDLRQAVARARAEFESISKELRRLAGATDRRDVERGIAALRERFKDARAEAEILLADAPAEAVPGGAIDAASIRPGLRVRLLRLGQEGYILTPPDSAGQVAVQVGIMRVMADASDLVQAEGGETGGAGTASGAGAAGRGEGAGGSGARPPGLAAERAAAFSPEIDLRGATVLDAIERVDKYLDDALLAGARKVRVIHGKGTGALREAVVAHLRAHPHVLLVLPGMPNEGGDGVAMAELR